MRTAIIATVRNEERRLPEFLASIERQTRKPDLLVITDGASTDGTQEFLREFERRGTVPFRWSVVPGNVPKGRNAAIELADAGLIGVVDVGVLEPTWFERIIAPLERNEADVVGGWYELLVENPRERVVGVMTQYSLDQVNPDAFLPSSRSIAFTREAWQNVGGYPEDLNATEDTMFDLRLRKAGYRIAFEPRAIVHWRPAPNASRAYRMYRRFAYWDGRAGLFMWSYSRYGLLYAAYGLGLALLLAGSLWPVLWIALLVLAATYGGFRIRKVFRERLWSQIPYALLVAAYLDVGLMIGYWHGRLWRRSPPNPDWR